MFGELKRILDRGFIIAFFLPALAFVGVSIWLLATYELQPKWLSFNPQEPLKETPLVAIITLAVALLLDALNRPIFRLMEGYLPLRIRNKLTFFQKVKYRELRRRYQVLYKNWAASRKANIEFKEMEDLIRSWERFSSSFPSQEETVLPTSFGNTVRAFEDYPRVMYGFESIQGWSRLHGVIPKDYRELMDQRYAATVLWVNLWFFSLLTASGHIGLSILNRELRAPFALPTALIFAYFAFGRARDAAGAWGEWVKAAFDLYLPALRKKMGFCPSANSRDEREFWTRFSQAIVYRHPESLNELDGKKMHGDAQGEVDSSSTEQASKNEDEDDEVP